MRKTYSLIFVAAACAALLVSIAVVTPKAVRAAVATLIRDQDNAARHPFVFEQTCSNVCSFFGGSTPDQEYVIQNVSVQGFGSGFTELGTAINCITAGQVNVVLDAISPGFTGFFNNGVLVRQSFPMTNYCDGSGTIVVEVSFYGAPSQSSSADVFVSGYYVTLP